MTAARRLTTVFSLSIVSALLPSLLSAQGLKVLLIDANTGRPMGKQEIIVHMNDKTIGIRTSEEGIALIAVPKPAPDNILIGERNGKLNGCGPGGFSVKEIMEHGVVGEEKWCGTNSDLPKRFASHPGVVVIFARKLHWWERMQT